MIYLDYNATTPLMEHICAVMYPYYYEYFGNPSALYGFGQKARGVIEDARAQVAACIGALPREIVFTASATEANNTILQSCAAMNGWRGHIIISAIEHPSVMNVAERLKAYGIEVTLLPVDRDGIVAIPQLTALLRDDTCLVSVMYANNETGTLQPIKEIVAVCRERKIYVHTDAAQAVGRIPVDVHSLGVDFLSFSSHKMYGPKGVGGLYIREGVPFTPYLSGGYQEFGRRAGTENVPAIVGFAEACRIQVARMQDEQVRIGALRDELEQALVTRVPGVKVNGHPKKRLYNTSSVCIEGISGQALVARLDFEAIYISTGASCSSGAQKASHVLQAMGRSSREAKTAIRISLGAKTTEQEIDTVKKRIPALINKIRKEIR